MKHKEIYTLGVIEKLSPLEGDLLEWLKTDKSFQGWLLTLNDKEFMEVYHAFDEDAPASLFGLIIAMDGKLRPGDEIDNEKFEHVFKLCVTSVTMIKMVRQGLIKYTIGKTDGDWLYELTENGQRVAEKIIT